MNSDGLLVFDFSTLEEHISQLLPEFIEKLIDSHNKDRLKYINNQFSFYIFSVPDGTANFFTAIRFNNNLSLFSVDELDDRYKRDILQLHRTTMMTRNTSPFAINLKYGHYAIDYFQAFLDMNNADLAYSFIEKYKKATSTRVQADNKKLLLDGNIKTIYQMAKRTNQYKNIYSQDPQSIKSYCDSDFECYFIEKHILNIVCYSSSIVYSCVFEPSGSYKIYAQRIHYGRKCERLNNIYYKEVDEHFEVTLMKHMYKEEFVIFEQLDDILLAYDFIIVDLLAVTKIIIQSDCSE